MFFRGSGGAVLLGGAVLKRLNCELFYFILFCKYIFVLFLYIAGVGVNPGILPCTTGVRPGCKRYMVGGKQGGWPLNKISTKINWIWFVLFHVEEVEDTLYKCTVLNGMHVRDIKDLTTVYTCIRNCIWQVCGCLSETKHSRALHILEKSSTLFSYFFIHISSGSVCRMCWSKISRWSVMYLDKVSIAADCSKCFRGPSKRCSGVSSYVG